MGDRRDLLRFALIGSVDDGKSTLIARLLHEIGSVPRDHLVAVEAASQKLGRNGLDLALLMDGLLAERAQAITIDVGYRRFSTAKREYIVADVPGHEQYTRNMVTGTSTAALVILLIDAQAGIRTQSKRHAFIASLMGVAHVIVAVNKMDLVNYSEARFQEIRDQYEGFCAKLSLSNLVFVPVSALHGDNVVSRGDNMRWYEGPTVLEHLESAYVGHDRNLVDLRLPIQLVVRPAPGFRGYAGTIASGVIRKGEAVMVLPTGERSTVASLVTERGEVDHAFAPQPITVVLEDDVDIARGDMLVHPGNQPRVLRRIETMLVWMAPEKLRTRRPYVIQCGTSTVRAVVLKIAFRIEPENLHRRAVTSLALNEIGRVSIETFRPLVCDDYARNKQTGCLVMIDPDTCETVAAGMIIDRGHTFHLPRAVGAEPVSKNVVREQGNVTKEDREKLLGHKAAVLWLTGLSSSGKTTIAYALEKELMARGRLACVIDGDNVRHGLNRDLGFAPADRKENIRRVAEVAALMRDSGMIVICSFISPYAEDRSTAAQIVGDLFLEVFVDAPLDVCEQRDRKGLYARARAGEIGAFTGVSAPYDVPTDPDIHLLTDRHTVAENVEILLCELRQRGVMPA